MINIDYSRDAKLTKFAKETLQDRYMLPQDLSPQDLFARVATAYGDDNEHAQRIYDYISNLWFMPATPVLANGGTQRGLPISCLKGDTLITTKRGFVPIKDIDVGEFVLTHKGRFRKVLAKKVSKSSNLYELKTVYRSTPIVITGNHLVLSEEGWKPVSKLSFYERIAIDAGLEAMPVNDNPTIHMSEFIGYETVEMDGKLYRRLTKKNRRRLNREHSLYFCAPFKEVKITKELARAIGMWLADGSLTINERKEPNGVRITLGADDMGLANFWLDTMRNSFGVAGNLHKSAVVRDGKLNSWISINVNGGPIGKFFVETFGRWSHDKSIPENWLSYPKEIREAMFNGFMECDGCWIEESGYIVGTQNNPTLMGSIHLLAMSLGVDMSLNLKSKPGKLSTCETTQDFTVYTLGWKKAEKVSNQQYAFSPALVSRLVDHRPIDVYDLQVEEDESFSASGVIVHNCFLSEAADNLEGIVDTWVENVWLAAKGGGLGVFWGNVRSIGERVGSVGQTSGIIPFIKVMDSVTLAVSQGSLRRGSAAVYLPMDHPEIEEFLEIRKPTGGDLERKSLNLHHAVVIKDQFMYAVEQDLPWQLKSPKTREVVKTVSARDLWFKILELRLSTGEPYITFMTAANRARPQFHKDANLSIKTSNLCVSGDTKILTAQGYRALHDLVDESVEIWTGKKFAPAYIMKTGTDQKLLKVTFSDGNMLKCTPYHKFFVKNDYHQDAIEKQAGNLSIGDKLDKWNLPVIEWGTSFDDAYTHGLFCAEGFVYQGENRLWLYDTKKPLLRHLRAVKVGKHDSTTLKIDVRLPSSLPGKFVVPYAANKNAKLEWLAGLLDGDGTVARNGKNQQLQICSINHEFLVGVSHLLDTLGVHSKVTRCREKGECLLPDGQGGMKKYPVVEAYRLLITSVGARKLLGLGMRCHRLQIVPHKPQRDALQHVQVISVEELSELHDTYCFNEPVSHKGILNGIQTGNCNEITLPTSNDRTAVCCLSSANLETYHEWEDHPTFVEDVMRFLDNVLSDFIRRAPDSMRRAKHSAERERSVGLGVMGFHGMLQKLGIPFDSVMAKVWNRKIFSRLKHQADMASMKLSAERGPCPDALDFDVPERFSYKLAIAPTASISIIAGASPSIEPWAANVFTQKTLSGSYSVRNPHLQALLAARGYDTEDVWSSIAINEGSVSHLPDYVMSDGEKEVYRTAFEIDQRWIVDLAAERQEFICQGQSLNIFLPPDVHKKYLHDLHVRAWKGGLKGLYYLRSKSLARAEKSSIQNLEYMRNPEAKPNDEECLSCQ